MFQALVQYVWPFIGILIIVAMYFYIYNSFKMGGGL